MEDALLIVYHQLFLELFSQDFYFCETFKQMSNCKKYMISSDEIVSSGEKDENLLIKDLMRISSSVDHPVGEDFQH